MLSPEYNISLTAGSSLGYQHTEATKHKISVAKSGSNHHFFGVIGSNHPKFGRNHSQDSKDKMSQAKIGEKNPMYGKSINGTIIYLYSLDLVLLDTFPSYRGTAMQFFSCSHATIIRYIRLNLIFRDRYILSLKELPSNSGSPKKVP